MAIFEHLGLALRALRVRADLSQKALAERAGVTQAMLSAYETERKTPTLTTLGRVLQALDSSFADLAREQQLLAARAGEPLDHGGSRVVLAGATTSSAQVPERLERILQVGDRAVLELLGHHLEYLHAVVDGALERLDTDEAPGDVPPPEAMAGGVGSGAAGEAREA